jgi:hypothetical protein
MFDPRDDARDRDGHETAEAACTRTAIATTWMRVTA